MRSFLLLVLLLSPLSAHAEGFCGAMGSPAAELKYISRGFGHGHTGLDMMAPHGSPIRAAAGGTVVYAGWYFAYGNIVDIRHADGVVTRYAHMSAFAPNLRAGTPVAPGQVIGKVGATGRAHGPHVHFEVRLNGRPVDPRPFLSLAPCTGMEGNEPIEEASVPEPRHRQKHR
jgi:murein DD-endopeptidase MepM/ murein hydrolase activator NlpD